MSTELLGRAGVGSGQPLPTRFAPHQPGGRWPMGRDRPPTPRWPVRHPVLLAAVATAALHLICLTRALGADEGGFAMVARFWQQPGGYLYGPEWVDRPPGLIAVFALADDLGPYGTRIMVTLLSVTLVLGVATAARLLGGSRAAGWAAWSACAFGSSVLLAAEQLNGEIVAATFVAWSMALGVLGWQRVGTPAVLSGAATAASGALAPCAVLMKQDFADALAFLVVLALLPASRTGRRPAERLRFAALAGTGALAVLAATVWWTRSHDGLGALLYATVGSRIDMARVMGQWSHAAPDHRMASLALLAATSGIGLLALELVLFQAHRVRRLGGVALALCAAGLVEVVGVVGGGNYWSHYLIALIPTVSIAAGLAAAGRHPGQRPTRLIVVAAVVVSSVSAPSLALHHHRDPGDSYVSARWLAGAAQPQDSLTVTYSHANVIGESGMRPAYPFSWSLPVRSQDPRLRLLRRTLAGGAAPTWVLQWDAPDTWGLDPDGLLDPVLRAHYRRVAMLCGRPVWLHDGKHRRLPPRPSPTRCQTALA